MSFSAENGEVKATLIDEKHDVSFPWWFNVVSLGVGKAMEAFGNKEFGNRIGDYIGQSLSSPSVPGFALAAQAQDDGSLKIFG
ncbi:MAG: hypothetical protein AAF171_09060 [Cyanobacteria bacterium P01_A01_bin.116]